MADVYLYRPDKTEKYPNVHDVEIDDGVLVFAWEPQTGSKSMKVQTTVPFLILEEIED
jgi:hypothetical protein